MQSLLFDGRTPGGMPLGVGKETLQQPAAVPSEIGEMEVLSTPRGTMIAGSVPLRHGLQLHELDASADASVQEPWQIEDKNRQRELRFPADCIES